VTKAAYHLFHFKNIQAAGMGTNVAVSTEEQQHPVAMLNKFKKGDRPCKPNVNFRTAAHWLTLRPKSPSSTFASIK
jgi:hypothetical protein